MRIVITNTPEGEGPAGKLASAEISFGFGRDAQFMDGLKVVGVSVFAGPDGPRVEFPTRRYTVCGERREFALVRPISENGTTDRLARTVLEAYEQHKRAAAV